MPITEFKGNFWFLSNFYPCQVEYEGSLYPTIEHAFQAAKTRDNVKRNDIAMAKSPAKAKRMGRKLNLRSDWNNIRKQVMETLVRKKFSNSPLKEMLLSTDNDTLIETNTWNDTFWGVCKGKGENNLGEILMKIRTELQNNLQTGGEK